MQRYGLIGYPLGHSFSKQYFSEKFAKEGIENALYELFPLGNIADLGELIAQHQDLRGLNVTIPYKELVIPFLNSLDETARAVGAVNCIKIIENQRLVGYNTDVIGFEKSLGEAVFETWRQEKRSALILGTGGASKAVAYVLKKQAIPFLFVSRKARGEQVIPYEGIQHQSATILINTSPTGTFPEVERMPPVPLFFLKPGMFVYDLIYNPAETLLLREAKSRGCAVTNGLKMLVLQAEAAWNIWH